jgi:hypothetical protein
MDVFSLNTVGGLFIEVLSSALAWPAAERPVHPERD